MVPLMSSIVLRINVRRHEIEGPNLRIFLAKAILTHIVSAFLIFANI